MSVSTVAYWVEHARGKRIDRVVFASLKPGRAWNRTALAVEERILSIRRVLRDNSVLGEYGTEAIALALQDEPSIEHVPSRATIHRVLAILRNPKVQAALAVRRTAIERRTEISQDQVRVELAHIAFFDPRGLFDTETGRLIDIPKLPEEVVAAISSVEITHNAEGERVTKVRWVSKIEALDKLCRHLGMYEDKLRIGGLERELAALSDEEIKEELIELRQYRHPSGE